MSHDGWMSVGLGCGRARLGLGQGFDGTWELAGTGRDWGQGKGVGGAGVGLRWATARVGPGARLGAGLAAVRGSRSLGSHLENINDFYWQGTATFFCGFMANEMTGSGTCMDSIESWNFGLATKVSPLAQSIPKRALMSPAKMSVTSFATSSIQNDSDTCRPLSDQLPSKCYDSDT